MSVQKLGLISAMLVLLCLSGCFSKKMSKEDTQVDLWEVLAMLPDSMKANHYGNWQGLDLNAEQLAKLRAEGELSMPRGWRWIVVTEISRGNHLKIEQNGMDDVLSYEVWHLQDEKSRPFIFAIQTFGDHCCNFGRWALYQLKGGALIDKTEEGLPKLKWEDFFTAEVAKGPMPPAFRPNNYPLTFFFFDDPARIEMRLVPDYIDLNYEGEISKNLLENLPADPKVLIWKAGAFAWQ